MILVPFEIFPRPALILLLVFAGTIAVAIALSAANGTWHLIGTYCAKLKRSLIKPSITLMIVINCLSL